MARFNPSLRPINRIKHVIDSNGALVAGTASITDIIATVDAPVITSPTQCETSSKVNGIFLKVEVTCTSTTAITAFYMLVFKNAAGILTAPAPNAVGISNLKKYVIHQEMVMLEKNTTSNPRTLFAGVVKIPRGYVRNGPLDKLQVSVFAPNNTGEFCIQAHYKEFR